MIRIQEHRRRGAVTVEFAMVCSLFFVLICGLMEFARVSIIRQALDNAAYEGARVGVIPGATSAEVIQAAEDHLQALQLQGWIVSVTPTPLTDSAEEVTVEVLLPIADNSWGTHFFDESTVFRGRSTLSTERYRGFAGSAP